MTLQIINCTKEGDVAAPELHLKEGQYYQLRTTMRELGFDISSILLTFLERTSKHP